MRILFICTNQIYPAIKGGRIASRGYFEPLTRLTDDLTVLLVNPKGMAFHGYKINKESMIRFPNVTWIPYEYSARSEFPFSFSTGDKLRDTDIYWHLSPIVDSEFYDMIESIDPEVTLSTTMVLPSKIPGRLIRIFYDQPSSMMSPSDHGYDFIKSSEDVILNTIRSISCTPLMKNAEYVPYYVPTFPSLSGRTSNFFITGSFDWFRFTESLGSINQLLDLIPSTHDLVIATSKRPNLNIATPRVVFEELGRKGYTTGDKLALILPTPYKTGIPSKVLEALSYGIPCLINDENWPLFAKYSGCVRLHDAPMSESFINLLSSYRTDPESITREFSTIHGIDVVANNLSRIINH